MGLAEGDAQDIEICYDKKHRDLLIQAISSCDVFGSLQKTAVPFFSSLGGKDNVIWIPAPCETEVYYLHKGNARIDRSGECVAYIERGRSQYYTLAVLHNSNVHADIHITGSIDSILEILHNIDVEIVNNLSYDTFCRKMKHYKTGIRMDCRYVDGRFPKTLAGMKVFSIGSTRVEAQMVLFPEGSFDPIRGTQKARDVMKKALDDETYRLEQVDKAFTKLIRIYSPKRVEAKIKEQLCRFE